ncbi:MAG: hypothetical protein RIS52_2235 [Pseudomonadota bacterium]
MSQATTQDVKSKPRTQISASTIENILSFATGLGVFGLLAYGWLTRADPDINPESGVGYWLGILGGSMMLLLLVYPFRKRIKFLANIGSIGFWFRFHMLLGLLGPVAILYHSRYSWGALNSAVALGAMLIVAGSGLVGRFFYSRVHRGYSGRKLEVRALLSEMHEMTKELDGLGDEGARIKEELVLFEKRAVAAGAGFWTSARAVIALGFSTRVAQRHVRREIKALSAARMSLAGNRQLQRHLAAQTGDYFHAVRRAGEFAFYDRMLRLWHLLHLPLFFLLIATAILHIIAVHMY